MDGKTLLAYVSAGGATESYAQIVADTLRSRGHVVDVVDLKRDKIPDLSSYGNVVVGTGVRIGMVYRKGKQFLRRKELEGKRLAIFLSSGMAVENAEKSRAKFLEPLVQKYGLNPVMCDAFPGKMPGFGGKLKDMTDPEIARVWAGELASKLSEPA
jgi:menaquinone-dependent protoporphyrinogen IX oxidase